jgi:hypothetical protein
MSKCKLLLGFCLVMLFSVGSWADTIDFTPTSSGSLGTSTMTYGHITATAYVLNGDVWELSTLWGRNDGSPEQGLGVCSEGASCSRSGDYNELSNEQNLELIVLTVDPGYSWVSVGLGSLDENSQGLPEQGSIWWGNTSDPNTVEATLFCVFAGGGSAEGCTNSGGAAPNIVFASPVDSSSLFIVPYDWNGNNSNNNDFLVRSAEIQPVPEPASLLLLGSGLVGLAGRMRRKFF